MKFFENKLLILLLSVFLFSCGENVEEFDGFLVSEVEHLLSFSTSKTWVKVETRVDGEVSGNECSDSLVYVFAKINGLSVEENQVFLGITSCTGETFCELYPLICEAYSEFCDENEEFCERNPGVIFAGTWSVVEPNAENASTNEFIINFPADTTRYIINFVTSQELQITHSENDVEVFEKLIHR